MRIKETLFKRSRSFLAVLLTLVLLGAALPAPAEETTPSPVRIMAVEEGFFATDANGNVWAWGKGGAALGIPGIGKHDKIKKPTAIALKNVADVQGCADLNAFLTTDGKVWLAGVPYVLRDDGNAKKQSGLRQVPIEGVRAISMTARSNYTLDDEMLLMFREDGTLWLRSEKTGLKEIWPEKKFLGFGPADLTLIHEDGAVYQYEWNGEELRQKRPFTLPDGLTPLESGISYARDEAGTVYYRTFNGGYKKARNFSGRSDHGLPVPDDMTVKKIYPCAALYEDGRVFVYADKWTQIPGEYADIAYSSSAGALLLDRNGNVSFVEGGQYGYDTIKEAKAVKTSLNLYKKAPDRKMPKLPGEDFYLPDGAVRAQASLKVYPAKSLVSKYKAKKKKGIPLYKPSAPQPLNVLITTADGHVKHSLDGPDNLEEWAERIVNASQGALRVVDEPGQAEVLITVLRKYPKKMYRTKGGRKVPVYNCAMTITATLLTDTKKQSSLSDKTVAPDSFKIHANATASIEPDPNFDKLPSLVDKILGWYGLNCRQGSKGDGVKRVQQALKTRQFYAGKISGTFDAASEQALKAFQESLGLEPTGTVDRETMVWLYYD